jgi:type I restriction enzyme S subunit
MKVEWPKKTLGEVCQFRGGGTPSKAVERYWQGKIPWVSPKDMKFDVVADSIDHISREAIDSSATSLIPKDSVLMVVRSGILARTVPIAITGRDLTINQDLKALCPNGTLDAHFLYHLLDSKMDVLLSMVSRGATVHRLMTEQIRALDFNLPPLPEQQRIVGILDEAFDGIATAKANAEKNLHNARALFESHLQSVFTQRGDSPVVPVGDVAEVFDGPHATPKTVDIGPVFLGIGALQDGKINLGETRHVTPEDFKRWTRRVKPQTDDIVFSYETRLGQAAIIPDGLECCLGRRMGLVRVNRKRVDPRFFVYQYISPPFRKFLSSKTVRGATVDRIALKEFPSFPINLPPLAEQVRMTNWLDTLREETQRLESLYQQKLDALEALKKSLLHQAFRGKLLNRQPNKDDYASPRHAFHQVDQCGSRGAGTFPRSQIPAGIHLEEMAVGTVAERHRRQRPWLFHGFDHLRERLAEHHRR